MSFILITNKDNESLKHLKQKKKPALACWVFTCDLVRITLARFL